MGEIWKDIKGLEGHYQISNLGRLRSVKFLKPRYKKPSINKDGYLKTILYINGIPNHKTIHRLVASAFCANGSDKDQVNHINGDKADNRSENLEWCTGKENIEHSVKNKLHAHGTRVHISKLNEDAIIAIRDMYKTGNYSHHKLAKMFNVSHGNIYKILNRRTWKHV